MATLSKALPRVLAAAGAGILAVDFVDRRTNIISDVRSIKNITAMLKELQERADQVGMAWEALRSPLTRTLRRPLRIALARCCLPFASHVLRQGRCSIAELFIEAVATYPEKECLVWSSGGRAKSSWTFREVDEITNKLSQWFADVHGIKPGSVVSLFFDNCPEIYLLQCALLKLAAIPCYINSNLRSTSLVHCINISGANLLFTEDSLVNEVANVLKDVRSGIKVYCWGSASPDPAIEVMTEQTFAGYDPKIRLGDEARRKLMWKDTGGQSLPGSG